MLRSLKTPEVGRAERRYDGRKKVKGRKRHMLVEYTRICAESQGISGEHSRSRRAKQLLLGIQAQFPRLQHLWVDGGDRTTFVSWIKEQSGWT